MGRQRHCLLFTTTSNGDLAQSPSSAVLTVFKQQVVMTATGIVWRAGVLEQGVAGHGLDYAFISSSEMTSELAVGLQAHCY